MYEEFVDRFVSATKELTVGDPADDGVTLGPVIDASAKQRLESWVDEARAGGSSVHMGSSGPETGSFVAPAVVIDPPADSHIACTEVFGPVIGVWKFADEEEGLRMANDSRYGLAAYACVNGLARVQRVAKALNAGIVGVNDGLPPTPELPFGGFDQSGYGKEGGHQGMAEFLREKYVSVRT